MNWLILKTPANIVKREYFYVCVRHVTFFLSVMHEWAWPSFGWLWPFLSGCGEVWPFLAWYGWIWVSATIFWLGVGECDVFYAGCCWVWVNVTFFCWVLVCVGGCDLFLLGRVGVGGCDFLLAGYGSVLVGVGKCGWVHGL